MTDLKPRFAFGKNWQAFLDSMTEQRIEQAVLSLQSMLQVKHLRDKRFLDIGSGSGLFSLAASRLGANVHSFDDDPHSVACTQQLRDRLERGGDEQLEREWTVEQGSVLDEAYLRSLGPFDVVYSWGVLHHTGQMRVAINNAAQCVGEDGLLFIAIYNDQGGASRRWLAVKRTYNRLPPSLQRLLVLLVAGYHETKFAAARLARLKNPLPFAEWRAKRKDRGMSVWHDWVDWCGGLPFEVATPEEVILPLLERGFALRNLNTCRGWGCNEFVFQKTNRQK